MSTSTESDIEKYRNIDLAGAVLPGAEFSHANFARANLARINLVGANLTMSNLVGANLSNGKLQGATLAFADLTDCDLTSADLSNTNLNKAALINADLSTANLRNANMQGTSFDCAKNVTWANLLSGRINEQTVIPEYLEEKALFEILSGQFSSIEWEKDYSGRLSDLWAELGRIADSLRSNSFSGALIEMAVHQQSDSLEE